MSPKNANGKEKTNDKKKKPPRKRAKSGSKTTKITDKKIIEAIDGSGGIVSNISEKLKVSWHTAKALIDRNDTTKAAYNAENEKMLDVGESVLMNLVASGDPMMLKFYLSTKGKNRGYGATVDVTTKGKELNGNTTIIKHSIIELPEHLKPKPNNED